MRLWGEDAAALERAGADLPALAGLEDGLAAEVARLRGRVEAVDAHVHLGRDADGHRLAPADLLADLGRWGIGRAVCFAANDPGPDGLPCGRCDSCRLRATGFAQAGFRDPLVG